MHVQEFLLRPWKVRVHRHKAFERFFDVLNAVISKMGLVPIIQEFFALGILEAFYLSSTEQHFGYVAEVEAHPGWEDRSCHGQCIRIFNNAMGYVVLLRQDKPIKVGVVAD